MRIAISGKSGCGNTTVSNLLSQKLGIPMVNFTFRQLSAEHGVDFKTFCTMAEKDDSIDKELDSRMVQMALESENSILGSRLAIWNMKDADLKVYLTASDEERAERIMRREGGSFNERLAETKARDAHDSARYKRIYGIDNNDTSAADLVIDTSKYNPQEIVDIIINYMNTNLKAK